MTRSKAFSILEKFKPCYHTEILSLIEGGYLSLWCDACHSYLQDEVVKRDRLQHQLFTQALEFLQKNLKEENSDSELDESEKQLSLFPTNK